MQAIVTEKTAAGKLAASLIRIETIPGMRPDPQQIFLNTAARETGLSRLLILYVTTGLAFMLIPGTFLGVWNLVAISSHHAAGSVSAAWVQAHGHAQIFGWIGTFILGIGFYSIPKLRGLKWFALREAWSSWVLWTSGVTLRWVAGMYSWEWRILLPLSAVLELAAFGIFFRSISGHRPEGAAEKKVEAWVRVVITGSMGMMMALVMNLGAAFYVAFKRLSPEVPSGLDQRLLVLQTWGWLVPFVWGFSARWLPVFLGLRPVRARKLFQAVAMNSAGVLAALAGWTIPASILFLTGIFTAIYALRLVEPRERPAKVEGVHPCYPAFVRLAYVWATIAAALGIWGSFAADPYGITGASRHALTVGFLATMVFAAGARVLPAFSGMRWLFSSKLMFSGLLLLAIGCLLRVSSEILAYQGLAESAWQWLPVSAICEMAAVTAFAINLLVTFARHRPT
jgi:hypothetical protein